jgi:hypothetical protein
MRLAIIVWRGPGRSPAGKVRFQLRRLQLIGDHAPRGCRSNRPPRWPQPGVTMAGISGFPPERRQSAFLRGARDHTSRSSALSALCRRRLRRIIHPQHPPSRSLARSESTASTTVFSAFQRSVMVARRRLFLGLMRRDGSARAPPHSPRSIRACNLPDNSVPRERHPPALPRLHHQHAAHGGC